MGVKLQSSAGGSVELNAPVTTAAYTLTVPTTSGIIATTDQLQNFRNKIINGGLQVWQRNTSQTTGGYNSVDRFYFGWSSGSLSVVKGVDVQPSISSDLGNYMLLGGTSLVGGYILHTVENVRTFAGQTCTLSYYYNNVSGTETGTPPYLRQAFGSGGSTSVDTAPISDTSVLVLGTIYRRVLVFNVPSVAGKTIAADNGALTIIIPVAGTFQKTFYSLQLEGGSVATPFEQRPFGLELQLCQRYYQQSTPYGWVAPYAGAYSLRCGIASTYNGVAAETCYIPFATTMRGTPTITFYRPSHSTGHANALALYSNGTTWQYPSVATTVGFVHSSGFIANMDVTGKGSNSGTSAITEGSWIASNEIT
jgi:hypothetical protein